jgi:F0F1-type ATP synthase assembly protein I
MVLEILIYSLILVSAIPVGFFLAYLCDDEVKEGKKWFKLISFILILLILASFFVSYGTPVILSLVYFLIVTLISLYHAK